MPVNRDAQDRATPSAGRAATAESVVAYRADLDGLRAVAVALVILTHAKWPWPNNGGDAGVTAFFVLSGYLITNLLLDQRERRGSIDILAFYRRRAVRLGPALLGLLAFVLAFGVLAGWGGGRHWQVGILTSLAYVSNWVQVGDLNIDPLGHTWSLAIEEQFYLVWPALLLILRGRALQFAVAAIVAASAIRLVATGPLEYFSTITRADAILLGCVLAMVRPKWPTWVAVAGLAILVSMSVLTLSHDILIPIAMVATTAVIGGRFDPLGRLAPVGLRAYSLYLWNWPMTILFGSIALVAPLMTVVIGELSFRLLEAPLLHRGRTRHHSAVANPVDALAVSTPTQELLTVDR